MARQKGNGGYKSIPKKIMFQKILIANRGEIAVRIMDTAQEMGIRTVAVYAAVEKDALHVQMADEAYCLGQESLAETYLNVDNIIAAAQKSRSQAIHPGYGFLSESPALVKACEENNITFIGPSSEVIRLMGNKIEARRFVKSTGVPVLEGITGSKEDILHQSDTLEYPVLVKAAAGGGGKGMRIVQQASQLSEALEATSREAASYFGDGTVYVEKYLDAPRHIEFQLLADQHGHVVHLFERECSVQRRYQKIIEEAPSPTLDESLRKEMGAAAVRIGQEIGYTSAGTIEFLLDRDKHFYFLEMNTRIQVEHPVTEMTTDVDIVEAQIRIAAGEPLSFLQEDLQQQGHAIECRVYAESPENQFMPSPGLIRYYHAPQTPGIRLDTALTGPATVDSRYDPMIGKLVAYAQNRKEAIRKAVDALKQYVIHGIDTNIAFLIHLLQTEAFQNNEISTKYCDQQAESLIQAMAQEKQKLPLLPVIVSGLLFDHKMPNASQNASVWQQIGFWRLLPVIDFSVDGETKQAAIRKLSENHFSLDYQDKTSQIIIKDKDRNHYHFTIDGQSFTSFVSDNEDGSLNISYEGFTLHFKRNDSLGQGDLSVAASQEAASDHQIVSPMPGKVIQLNARPGQEVKKGDTLLIVEAMKMENSLLAPRDGKIKEVRVAEQEMVERNKPLILLEELRD